MVTVHGVLVDIIYLAGSAAIIYVVPKLKAFYDAHTTAQERAVLATMAQAVVPEMAKLYAAEGGPKKMSEAINMVDMWLKDKGINLTVSSIEAAIEEAYATAKKDGKLSVYPVPAKAPAKAPVKDSAKAPVKAPAKVPAKAPSKDPAKPATNKTASK